MTLPTKTAGALTLAAALALSTAAYAENASVVFGTNWLAQAEHGGFYQLSPTAPMPPAGWT